MAAFCQFEEYCVRRACWYLEMKESGKKVRDGGVKGGRSGTHKATHYCNQVSHLPNYLTLTLRTCRFIPYIRKFLFLRSKRPQQPSQYKTTTRSRPTRRFYCARNIIVAWDLSSTASCLALCSGHEEAAGVSNLTMSRTIHSVLFQWELRPPSQSGAHTRVREWCHHF